MLAYLTLSFISKHKVKFFTVNSGDEDVYITAQSLKKALG